MSTTRTRLLATVCSAAAALAGGAAPAQASLMDPLTPTGSLALAASAPPPAQAMEESRASMASQYASTYHISQADAEAIVQIQAKGSNIVSSLENALGSGYAGVWFEASHKQFVAAVGPDGSTKAANAVFANSGLGANSRVITVPWTMGQLEKAIAELSEELHQYVAAGEVQIALGAEDHVQITIATTASASLPVLAEQAAARTGVDPRIVTSERASLSITPDSYSEPGNGGPPLIAGMALYKETETCSYGFYVTSPVAEGAFFLTAGHCTVANQKEWACQYGGSPCYWVGHDIGGYVGAPGDEGILHEDYPETWGSYPAILDWDCGCVTIPVRGVGKSYIGEVVAHTGWGSGHNNSIGTTYGEVFALNQTVHYTTGQVVEGLTGADGPAMCVFPGDSGGPVFDPNSGYALGILDAGTAGCNTTVYYSEVEHAAAVLNVTVQHT